ncbi:HhH GPD superfamily base excision DNA repair protein Helix hairpin helix motifNUDIX domain [Trypanosoma vivax]|nr:HhH GPD superfamily base excision DNA repair protein Helix hairpin helix motifNUDIX domain [Trypanosoma vivax]
MRNSYVEIQHATIEWFRKNQRRDLPWRQSTVSSESLLPTNSVSASCVPNPYHIWVSEVMSQQTQMDTVIAYFKKWVSLFPTIATLAEASEDSVKSAWSGMGYYRRALFLRKGAQYVVENFAGKLPNTAAQLQKIPGIGAYTAAAIASICFGESVAAVDGNLVRVLCRLRCEREFDPKLPKNIKTAFLWGQEIVAAGPCESVGEFNQGLMEIGARICKPAGQPLCGECPLQHFCGAYSAKLRGELAAIEGIIPLRAKSVKKKQERVLSVVHEFRPSCEPNHTLPRRFLVIQRPDNGLLGGMLEFPSLTYISSSSHSLNSTEEDESLRRLCKRLGADHGNLVLIGHVRHIFTHIDMEVRAYHAVWKCSSADNSNGKRVFVRLDRALAM